MNITQNNIDTLNAEITITLNPADYETQVSEGIKKVQRQANMPGFRPGKVPSGLIKKQYGTQILVDEINKILNDSIYKFIEENKIEILGNPMPKDQTSVDFTKQTDFEFVYQLGLAPEFKVELDKNLHFKYKVVKIDEELIEKYLKDVRRNYGKPANPEVSTEKDVVFVDINELDETGNIKPGGIFKSTSLNFERLAEGTSKAKLIGLKKEDKLVVSINEFYLTALDKSVSLGIDKELAETTNCNIQLTVKNISRLEDAELNQELFDKLYGEGKINSLDEFKDKIRQELTAMFDADAERFLKTEVENKMVEAINPKLPDSFLKRWLMTVNEKPITVEELESDYPNYSKAMQWRLIENKIIKDNNLKVESEEIANEAKAYIRGEYAKYGQVPSDEDLEKITKDLLSKEKEAQKIVENLYSKHVLALIKEKCSLDFNEVSYDDFFKA
jgi:trigger factor